MHKFQSPLLTVFLLLGNAVMAQNTPANVAATPDTVAALKGLNFIEGADKKMHLVVDGRRVGSFQFDPEWAKSRAKPIPPEFVEPHPRFPPKPRDPCIFAAAGKCVPNFKTGEPLIRFPKEIGEIGLVMRKK